MVFKVWLVGLTAVGLCMAAPAPKYRVKGPQVESRVYLMQWGGAVPDRARFYPDGTYEHHYTTKITDWETGDFDHKTQHILGIWKWDPHTRILTLKEERYFKEGFEYKLGGTWVFHLQPDKLETTKSLYTTHVYLSLKEAK